MRFEKTKLNAERARRRAAKKNRKCAQFSEGLRVQKVYERKVPPIVEASSTALLSHCVIVEAASTLLPSSSSLREVNSSYETLFPSSVRSLGGLLDII